MYSLFCMYLHIYMWIYIHVHMYTYMPNKLEGMILHSILQILQTVNSMCRFPYAQLYMYLHMYTYLYVLIHVYTYIQNEQEGIIPRSIRQILQTVEDMRATGWTYDLVRGSVLQCVAECCEQYFV